MEEKMLPFPFEFALGNHDNKKFFLDTVEKVLTENLQSENSFGCKIRHCHTHVGSERHLSEFIEAELLFHNSYYNKGFALITVEKILEWLDVQRISAGIQKVLLVGYENFSELYLCETVDTLNEVAEGRIEAQYCIYENIGKIAEVRKLEKLIENGFLDEYVKIVFVIPISTTFTTFQKLFMAYRGYLMENHCPESLLNQIQNADNILNISLIVVAKSDNFYWQWSNEEKKVLHLDRNLYKALPQKAVNCFSYIESEWYPLEKCPYCFPDLENKRLTDESPLFGVNRTSVVPMLQLGKWKNQEPFSHKRLENAEADIYKVIQLTKHMQYKHLQRNGNHFQFYFDTEAFFKAERSKIEEWLKEEVYSKLKEDIKTQLLNKQESRHNARLEAVAALIPEEGSLELMQCLQQKAEILHAEEVEKESNQIVYDFLVAPRHYSNAGFVHAVNDCVFEGTARIFYFDVQREYRGNINAKYSDFQRHVANIKSSRQHSLIRFHFVDDTIYSSGNFKRAQSLISTLAGTSDDYCEIQLYASAILLLGRNSKGTKEFLLGRKGNFFEYVHLDISPMRNHEDACTVCMIENNYHKMRSVSAMNRMNKNCLVNLERHKLHQIQEMKMPYEEAPLDKRLRLIITHIVNVRINNQFKLLKKDTPINRESSKQMYLVLKTMWEVLPKLLKNYMPEEAENCDIEFSTLVKIAFIKTITRPFFAYHIRQKQAAFKFCLEKTEDILCQKEITVTNRKILTSLLNGLADMDANYLIRQENIEKILTKADHEAYFNAVKKLTSLSKGDTKVLLLEAILTRGNEKAFFDTQSDEWRLNIPIISWLSLYIENNQILVNGFKKWNNISATVGENGYGIGNFCQFFEWNGVQDNERIEICDLYSKLSKALPSDERKGSVYHPDFAHIEELINRILNVPNAFLFVEDEEHHTIIQNEMDRYILLKDTETAAKILYNSSEQKKIEDILRDPQMSMVIGDTIIIPYNLDFYLIKITVETDKEVELNNIHGKAIYVYVPGKHEHVKPKVQSVSDCSDKIVEWLPLLFRIKVLLSLRNQIELLIEEYFGIIIRLIRKEQMEKALSISKATGHGMTAINRCLNLDSVIDFVTADNVLHNPESIVLKQMFDKHIRLLANNFISEIYRMIHTGDLEGAKKSEEIWMCKKLENQKPLYMIFFNSYIEGRSEEPRYEFIAPRKTRREVNVKFQFEITKEEIWQLRCLKRRNVMDSPTFNIVVLLASNVAYHNTCGNEAVLYIYKENRYLCLKNKWDLYINEEERETPNDKIKEIRKQLEVHPSKKEEGAGISLWSLKRYCEILNEKKEECFDVTYEENDNEVYFVVKMMLF